MQVQSTMRWSDNYLFGWGMCKIQKYANIFLNFLLSEIPGYLKCGNRLWCNVRVLEQCIMSLAVILETVWGKSISINAKEVYFELFEYEIDHTINVSSYCDSEIDQNYTWSRDWLSSSRIRDHFINLASPLLFWKQFRFMWDEFKIISKQTKKNSKNWLQNFSSKRTTPLSLSSHSSRNMMIWWETESKEPNKNFHHFAD